MWVPLRIPDPYCILRRITEEQILFKLEISRFPLSKQLHRTFLLGSVTSKGSAIHY